MSGTEEGAFPELLRALFEQLLRAVGAFPKRREWLLLSALFAALGFDATMTMREFVAWLGGSGAPASTDSAAENRAANFALQLAALTTRLAQLPEEERFLFFSASVHLDGVDDAEARLKRWRQATRCEDEALDAAFIEWARRLVHA